MSSKKTIYHRMKPFNQRMAKVLQRGYGPKRLVLLLTTKGRKSGLPRQTPLQYEEYEGDIYIGSARGAQADWWCNLVADPHVQVQVGGESFEAMAEAITTPSDIADFLEFRLQRHPVMIRLIMCLGEGLPWRFTREELEKFAEGKAVVRLIRILSQPQTNSI